MPTAQETATRLRLDTLSAIFAPGSVAVVGASDTVTKIGGVPVDFLRRLGYAGQIYPVNPKPGLVQGLKAYPCIAAIGAPVDLAIFAVPAKLVPAALDDAIASGVRGVVLFTSGFAETGAAGAQAQAQLRKKAQAAGVRLLGPNCLGFMNVRMAVYATFTPAPNVGLLPAGNIGIVSQSGAFGAYAYSLARARGLGMSHWITTGNESDIDFADCMEWMAHDPNTKVIMGYMEGCRDGLKLRRALAAAHTAKKPVVIVKVGRTAIGAQAAASHTAALAGNDAVYDTLFKEYGVYRARDIAEFFGVAAAASIAALPADRSLGIFTLSGGVGVLMADEAGDANLDLRPMPQDAQDTIRSWVPFAGPNNPVDITGQVTNDRTLMERTARLMLDKGQYATWLCFLAAGGASDTIWPVLEALVTGLRRDYPNTLLAISTLLTPARQRTIEAMGCLVFGDPSEAVRTIAALNSFAEAFARPVPALPEPGASAERLPAGTQTEPQGLATLAAAGVQIAPNQVVHSAQAAVDAAAAAGTAVVLKIVSPDISHKSDVGGVALGLSGADAVRKAYETMLTTVRTNAPQARLEGVLVAPMVLGGVECILGAQFDPVFGPMVLFGLGGVFVELLGDVALHTAPVSEPEALQMIRSTKGYGLLAGARGRPPVDVDCLARNLAALSRLAAAAGESLMSIDINPFIALPQDQGGGFAVDAVVVGRTLADHTSA